MTRLLTKIWRAYTRPVKLAGTTLIVPMCFASVQATIKVWNLTYSYMSESVYDVLLPVVQFIVEYGNTLGWIEIGVKVGLIIAYNRVEAILISAHNRENTFY